MKKSIFVVLCVLTLSIQAQEFPCGVESSEPFEIETQRRQRLQSLKTASRQVAQTTYVPLQIHLFGANNGVGYLSRADVNEAVAHLNREYRESGIQFYFKGEDFAFHPNTQFYTGNYTLDERDNFHMANGAVNAVNVYIPNTVYVSDSPVAGYSAISPTTQLRNRMFIRKSSFNNDRTTAHEMGHYFSLQHTFNGFEQPSTFFRELVTRNFNEPEPRLSANCDAFGDYLCDTPADPYIAGNFSVVACQYVGTMTDLNDDPYNPYLDNYMSYYICPPHVFTEGQIARAADGLLLVTDPTNEFTLDAPETPQTAPGIVSAELTGSFVNLSWIDNSSVETGFFIEQATSVEGPWIAVHGTAPNISFAEIPAIPNLPNYFRIKPSNSKDNYSEISNAVTFLNVAQTPSMPRVILSPNPAVDKLNISIELTDVSIVDVAGKIVLEQKSAASIDIENLASGLYFLKGAFDTTLYTAKFFKE